MSDDDNVTNDDKKVKKTKTVAKKKEPTQSRVNVQELARTDTFLLKGVASPEFVQKAALNALKAAGYNIVVMESARGGGFAFKHEVKVTK